MKSSFSEDASSKKHIDDILSILPTGDAEIIRNALTDCTETRNSAAENGDAAQFRAIVEYALDFIFIKDSSRVYTFANRSMRTFLGLSHDEIIGRTADEIFGPELGKLIKEVDDRVFAGETVNVSKGFRSGKREYIFNTLQTALSLKDGRVDTIVGIVRDVTELRQAEENLLEEQRFFLSTMGSVSDGFLILEGEAFKVLVFNRAAEKLLGRAADDVLGRPFFSAFPEFLGSIFETNYREEFEKKKLISFETYFEIDPYVNWYDVRVYPGKNVVTVFFKVTTARKKAENALQQYKYIVSSSTDLLALIDTEFRFLAANDAYAAVFDATPDQLIGNSIIDLFGKEIFNRVIKPRAEKCLNGETVNYQAWFDLPKSGRCLLDTAYSPYLGENGEVLGFTVIGRDITERQKMQETIQHAAKLESLGVLAGGIAHDFNNLLGGIFGYINLAHNFSTDERVSNYLAKTLVTIDRARGLTRQLLTFAKGGAPVRKLEALFPFIKETAQFALSGANVSCEFEVPADLWPCNFDKYQIGQVIENLIINAQQAMPDGGTIKLVAQNYSFSKEQTDNEALDNCVKISITDTGIGMPKEILGRIFDPFFTTKSQGHGLGLSTCYSIVSRHQGRIEVDSEPGKGTVFHVYLPACVGAGASQTKSLNVDHQGRGTILMMDDEEIIRETLGEMLESVGYRVICQGNGRDAIEHLVAETKANRKIDAMILDLTIPGGMGGKEAITEIRKLDDSMPVFVASGYAEDPVMADPVSHGFTASIPKPFALSELLALLDRYLQRKAG
jgi:PAS domain S-box-containing protein